MRSELSFLMELFLRDDVPKPIKGMVADRLREVEETMAAIAVPRYTVPVPQNWDSRPPVVTDPSMAIGDVKIVTQAPSMQRIMAKHPEVPVNQVVPTTPAAAQALAARAALLNTAANEKPEPGRTSKRKF